MRHRSDHLVRSMSQERISLAAPPIEPGERQMFSATGTASSGLAGDRKHRLCGDCLVFLSDRAATVVFVAYADRENPTTGYEGLETIRVPHDEVTRLAGGSRPIGRELLLIHYGEGEVLEIVLPPGPIAADLIEAYREHVHSHALRV